MADKENPGNPKQPLQEDGVVARLKNASGGELTGLTTYTGLLSRSSKEGYWLLYPTLDMSTCVEIQDSDIVHSEPLPPEQSPFGGLGGTLVFVRKGAQVTTTRTISRTSQAGGGDEFDLDLRVGQAVSGFPGQEKRTGGPCSIPCSEVETYCRTCRGDCFQGGTLNAHCDTRLQDSCRACTHATCHEHCFQAQAAVKARTGTRPTLGFTCRMTDEC